MVARGNDTAHSPQSPQSALMRAVLSRAAGPMRELSRRGRTEADWLRSRRDCADVAVFQQFFAPPYGGGNQFLLALVGELRRRSLTVEVNRLSGGTPACLYNSFNFDFSRLRRFARNEARMVHRVDGPIGAYRGFDDGTDRRIIEINRELADATIVQSQFSLEKHRELGLDLRDPVVIPNSVDPSIFHRPESREPLAGRRLRVIATSWSDNPRKGGEVLEWLDRNLDTRLVRIHVRRTHAEEVRADSRRATDPFRAAGRSVAQPRRLSRTEQRRSLFERAARGTRVRAPCCVPAQRRSSRACRGGRTRVRRRRRSFRIVFARLRHELDARRAAIRVPALADVADRYLEVLRG